MKNLDVLKANTVSVTFTNNNTFYDNMNAQLFVSNQPEASTADIQVEDTLDEVSEIDFLRYFFHAADFGPADDDVRTSIMDMYKKETGLAVPYGYDYRDLNE